MTSIALAVLLNLGSGYGLQNMATFDGPQAQENCTRAKMALLTLAPMYQSLNVVCVPLA
jgi:hypothetical protein